MHAPEPTKKQQRQARKAVKRMEKRDKQRRKFAVFMERDNKWTRRWSTAIAPFIFTFLAALDFMTAGIAFDHHWYASGIVGLIIAVLFMFYPLAMYIDTRTEADRKIEANLPPDAGKNPLEEIFNMLDSLGDVKEKHATALKAAMTASVERIVGKHLAKDSGWRPTKAASEEIAADFTKHTDHAARVGWSDTNGWNAEIDDSHHDDSKKPRKVFVHPDQGRKLTQPEQDKAREDRLELRRERHNRLRRENRAKKKAEQALIDKKNQLALARVERERKARIKKGKK